MFNKNFYPTPTNVIKKMLAPFYNEKFGYNLGSKLILEPSGGKGDIIDFINDDLGSYRRTKIHTLEIEPDLQNILLTKDNTTLVGSDFLNYYSPYQYDLIIMNPPFEDGVKHLLKAWNLLRNGDIICLLNKETLNNPFSKERKLLQKIIEDQLNNDLGSIEDFGQCFKNSERGTNVEVVCIRLKKEGGNEFEFDISEFEKKDFVLPDEIKENNLELRDLMENYENRYNSSIEAFKEMIKAMNKFKSYSKIFIRSGIDDYMKMAGNQNFNSFVSKLNGDAWNKFLEDSKYKTYLTKKVKESFTHKFSNQKNMAYTKKNMQALAKILILNQGQILADCVEEVFDLLTRYDIKNRVHVEGWKTNDSYKVNRKVIIPNINWWKLQSKYSCWYTTEKLNDIDRAMCHLMSYKIEDIITISEALTNGKYEENYTGALINNKVKSTFFEITYYKKGTIHLWFKEKFVWDEFNQVACKNKNWIPDEVTL